MSIDYKVLSDLFSKRRTVISTNYLKFRGLIGPSQSTRSSSAKRSLLLWNLQVD